MFRRPVRRRGGPAENGTGALLPRELRQRRWLAAVGHAIAIAIAAWPCPLSRERTHEGEDVVGSEHNKEFLPSQRGFCGMVRAVALLGTVVQEAAVLSGNRSVHGEVAGGIDARLRFEQSKFDGGCGGGAGRHGDLAAGGGCGTGIEAENEGGDVGEVGWSCQFIEHVGMDGGQGESGAVVPEAETAAGTGSGTRVEEGALVSGAQGRILEGLRGTDLLGRSMFPSEPEGRA